MTVSSNRGLSREGKIVFSTININFPAEGSDIRYFMHLYNFPAEAAHLLTIRLANLLPYLLHFVCVSQNINLN